MNFLYEWGMPSLTTYVTSRIVCCSDLSSHGEIQSVILESFSSQNEEVKSAASYALGKTFYDCSSCRDLKISFSNIGK